MISHYNYSENVNDIDFNGSTILHAAVKTKNLSLAREILQLGQVDINRRELKSVGGMSALHMACENNDAEMVRLLLAAGANVDIKTDTNIGEGCLHLCCRLGVLSCAELLVRGGVNVNLKDNLGNNASFWAHSKQHDDIIKCLSLPPPRSATAEEHFAIMKQRNLFFSLPEVKKKKKSGKKSKKGKK